MLEETCQKKKATILRLGQEFKARSLGRGKFSYQGRLWQEHFLPCPLRGRHQIDNAALALAALEVMADRGFPVDGAAIRSGLAMTRWEGRMETIPGSPPVILDGAHNPAAMSVLCRALKEEAAARPIVFLFGVLGDKDAASMLKKMRNVASGVILTETLSNAASLWKSFRNSRPVCYRFPLRSARIRRRACRRLGRKQGIKVWSV